MDESEGRDEGAHQIDRGGTGEGGPGPSAWEATKGKGPLEAEMRGEERGVFPPDTAPGIDVGGSPEEQQMLEEEMNH